ncbi:B3/B4 domain-containing protein [Streptomyces sp. 3211]|uniref:B3/B4 domain-containing protein n=1 Tax=Streptomyces sp. 3211 TaxID=1964449 RepID=UPI0009A4EF43|nr:phenylalanine--tRNA ligase beta subunit-related protein [Streptomyces sp. 3211]
MTVFRLSPEVSAAFPTAVIALVTAEGLRGHEPWPEVGAALADIEQAVASGQWAPADETDPRIASWHDAYRSFGTNPRRERPSVDALGRRLVRKGTLPRISSAVDAYNTVSIRHGLPAGAFDLDALSGDVVIRFATGSEEFVPLGEPDTVENPKAGEVIYEDGSSVLTRHWNHRDAHRTRVTEESVRVVFLLETVDADAYRGLLERAAQNLRDWLTPHASSTTVHFLSGENTEAKV